jgi:proteasome assembly chaperone (PAC2) family protein
VAAPSELEWLVEPQPVLQRPVLLVALEGLFDVAGVATDALEWLTDGRPVETIAAIDPDAFYDFTQERPQVRLEDDERVIDWPENEFKVVRFPSAGRDLVVLSGVEPHIRWSTFADHVIDVARATRCELIVTAGGVPEPIPHTRTPQVFGSSTNAELARRMGLSRPQYQGPTGLVGVLQTRLDELADGRLPSPPGAPRIAGIALRVPVPHYLINAQHPKSTAALLRHLEHVLGVPTNHRSFDGEIARWTELHESAVATDAQATAFVKMLEREYDRQTEARIPTADDLAAELEQFLKEQRAEGDEEDGPGDQGDEPDDDVGPS